MIHHIVRANASAQFQTVHARHHQVGYYEVGHNVDSLLQSVLTIGSVSHGIAVVQHIANIRRNVAVVLNDEHRALVVIGFGVHEFLLLSGQFGGVVHRLLIELDVALVGYRNLDVERRSLAHLALYTDLTMHRVDYLLHQSQTYARAQILQVGLTLIK